MVGPCWLGPVGWASMVCTAQAGCKRAAHPPWDRTQGLTPSGAALAAVQAPWLQNGLSPASSEDAPARAAMGPGLGTAWSAASPPSPARAGAGGRGALQGFEGFSALNPAQPQLHAIAAAPACDNPFSNPAAWGSPASSRHTASPDCGMSGGPGDRQGDPGYTAVELPQALSEQSSAGVVSGSGLGCRSAPAALPDGGGLPQVHAYSCIRIPVAGYLPIIHVCKEHGVRVKGSMFDHVRTICVTLIYSRCNVDVSALSTFTPPNQ